MLNSSICTYKMTMVQRDDSLVGEHEDPGRERASSMMMLCPSVILASLMIVNRSGRVGAASRVGFPMVGIFLLVVVMGCNVVWSTAHPGQHGVAAGAQEAPDQQGG